MTEAHMSTRYAILTAANQGFTESLWFRSYAAGISSSWALKSFAKLRQREMASIAVQLQPATQHEPEMSSGAVIHCNRFDTS